MSIPGTPKTESESENSLNTVEGERTTITPSLEGLQSDEQRRVLDTVSQVRKCGLESILALPQLVVCGDQSSGKSSVLEALTEIPFPRSDNLCTRFATEIILRRATADSLTIKILPGPDRSASEQNVLNSFKEAITNFDELPQVMEKAVEAMGINNQSSVNSGPSRKFAQDVLRIEIEGPTRPQLTLVDIPGIIGASTRGVSDADIQVVAELTDRYISQSRTICLAVVAASGDYATQTILTKVRAVDPDGSRTLGIITKPDRIEGNGAAKDAFVELALNRDVKFKLGWHVLKNRTGQERDFDLAERKRSESEWFRNDPGFKLLPSHLIGIDALRYRLSSLLFEHIKKELPQLREDLEEALDSTRHTLKSLGESRSDVHECRNFLTSVSMQFQSICQASINGHYEGVYFRKGLGQRFDIELPSTFTRIRAAVQNMNTDFSNKMGIKGNKFIIDMDDETDASDTDEPWAKSRFGGTKQIPMNRKQAIGWVQQILHQNRGRELSGNFNPLIVGQLFWQQSINWNRFAEDHRDAVGNTCSSFLSKLLEDLCPEDVRGRLWDLILDQLKEREDRATQELGNLLTDLKEFPINYNHYYTETIKKRRQDRHSASIRQSIVAATVNVHQHGYHTDKIDSKKLTEELADPKSESDMEKAACEEAIDCLFAIYKVLQKNFIANVTTQVIERHIVRGLESIFSPLVVNDMSDAMVKGIASEPLEIQREREGLLDKIAKLEEGQKAFKSVMAGRLR